MFLQKFAVYIGEREDKLSTTLVEEVGGCRCHRTFEGGPRGIVKILQEGTFSYERRLLKQENELQAPRWLSSR